jgi:predicted Zn-dependent protease
MRLARVAPDSVWLHQVAGEANESQGLYDAAIAEYRRVLAASLRRPGIRFRIGRVLLERAKSERSAPDTSEARQAFQEELAVDPTNANAAYELAEMARKAGEFDRARERFVQALTHYPAFEHALVGLGRTLIALGRPAEALPHLKAAIATNPESDVAWYQLAQAYRKLGDSAAHESALAEFKRVRILTAQRTAVPHTKRDITPQALDLTSPK